MGKQKTKKAAFASINEKYANARLEGLNNEARDGKELTSAYSRFNKTTLPLIRNQISSLDMEFNVIDALAR